MRVVLGVSYQGRNFRGWQRQKASIPTVQAAVEKALSYVANEPVTTACAGRTDAGVHATGQVIHFDTQVKRSTRQWVLGANTQLCSDVRIRWARFSDQSFHARFSAKSRSYRYIIDNNNVYLTQLSAFSAWEPKQLNLEAMQEACAYLKGTYDFTAFQSSGCQAKSPVKTIFNLSLSGLSGGLIAFEITANSFLYRMVRNIVGVLLQIGKDHHPPHWMFDMVRNANKLGVSYTAPSRGLTLSHVGY